MKTLSEEIVAKAERLLLEERVRLRLSPEDVVAYVDSDSGRHLITRNEYGGISCSCPADGYGTICAHVLAVSYVVRLEGREER